MNPEETILKDINNTQQIIAIPLEEYKELLIIKGKYEEVQKSKLIYYDGYKEDGTTIIPQRELKTTDPLPGSPYKVTC